MSAEKIDLLRGEIYIFEKIEDLFEPGRDEIIPAMREIADEQFKRRARIEAGLQIAGGHGQLVEVGQQTRVLPRWPCIAQVCFAWRQRSATQHAP